MNITLAPIALCFVAASLTNAQPIFSEVPSSSIFCRVNNIGTVVGYQAQNGYRWRQSDGLTNFQGIPISDISDDDQVMISQTQGKWTASTNQWTPPRGYQFTQTPCPNPPCIAYTEAVQRYCNTDGSIIVGTAREIAPNNCHSRAVLWNSSSSTPAATISDGYPNGGVIECTSAAILAGMSANGEVVWGVDQNQNINAVRAFVWHNGLKRNAFAGLSVVNGGATPDGRYVAGYAVSQTSVTFRGIYDTINLQHINFPNGYWPTCMAESSMLVGGEFTLGNLGTGRAFLRLENGQRVDLYNELLARNVQGPITGWTLTSVRHISRNARYLVGYGTNLQGAFRVFRVDLLGNTCDSIDFNNDNSVFDPQDIDTFLSVYSEGPCVPESATCNDIDFNNDGSLFDPRDIDAFLSVFSEGPCL